MYRKLAALGLALATATASAAQGRDSDGFRGAPGPVAPGAYGAEPDMFRCPPDPCRTAAPAAAAVRPHPFRVSVADVSVADDVLEARIRFFWDDLEFGMMESTGDMEFRLRENAEVDALVEEYINEMLVLEVDGAAVPGRLAERGIQSARLPDEIMWWYRMQYAVDRSVDRVSVTNRLLFNMFEDQRNLVQLTTADGRERTQYFTWDNDSSVMRIR